jgi:hypothetical protein
MTTYLDVPYSEKDNAKLLGARWDSNTKQWYSENNNTNLELLLSKWKINSTPIILNGEDRSFGSNDLFVDLIPKSCWFINIRSSIQKNDWDRLRKHIYQRANYICECCKINTKQHNTWLEAHERWKYDYTTKTQKLMRLIALCHECYQTTHIGLAQINDKYEEATNHLKKVRNFSDAECQLHIHEAFNTWRERNKYRWKLDITLITNNGIKLNPID